MEGPGLDVPWSAVGPLRGLGLGCPGLVPLVRNAPGRSEGMQAKDLCSGVGLIGSCQEQRDISQVGESLIGPGGARARHGNGNRARPGWPAHVWPAATSSCLIT